MATLDKQTKRVLALFGKNPAHVTVNVGTEQEYFLISEKDYERRQDLIVCGRTLFARRRARAKSSTNITSAPFALR